METLYKAKVNGLYVKGVYEACEEIELTPREKSAKLLTEKRKDYLLKYFPDAKLSTYNLDKTSW